jgi:hypothetical protein
VNEPKTDSTTLPEEKASSDNPSLADSNQNNGNQSHEEDPPQEHDGFYSSFRKMRVADIPEVEEIIFGTGRGDIAILNSVTNVGKTTLALNTALSIAAGEPYSALAPNVSKPRRVLYCDFEASRSMLLNYVSKMLLNLNNQELAQDNLAIICDSVIKNQPLNLSNPIHRQNLTRYARNLKIDLIIIDTVGAAISLEDENSNAEVTSKVMQPLKTMAREVNAAILLCHHLGKPANFQRNVPAYAGRGASAWGALSRTVFLLHRDNQSGNNYPVLYCAKAKRSIFEPQQLRLNEDVAWFEVLSQPLAKIKVTDDMVIEFVSQNESVQLKQIRVFFNCGPNGDRNIRRKLENAIKKGIMEKPAKGIYSIKKSNKNRSVNTPD